MDNSCEVHLEGQIAKTRADPERAAPSPPGGSHPRELQAEAQWACISGGFPANIPEVWNPESQNTPQKTLRTVEYSLLRQRVQGESVPNKDPDVSERPGFLPNPHPG